MPKYAVILPAAGKSSRFGGLEKKPFVSLAGRPVWVRSAELFWNRPDVTKVSVVLDPEDRDEFLSRFGHLLAFANAALVDGGAERFESVANALAGLDAEAEFVAVHDAVRPLTPPQAIDAVFAAAAEHGAALLGVPVADTLKRVDPTTGRIVDTVPRAGLWQAQTPQVFRRDWLTDAYARRGELSAAITDDAQLLEACGRPVVVVPGSPTNFKITTRDDLAHAEKVLAEPPARKDEPPGPAGRFGDEEGMW